ncbi:Veg family protein [Vagococcus fluvialis]|uniref:Veg family protein n=1 Tax=Vagococcus fluvialis TaxID=2738 RepID=UPI003B20D0CB
MAASILTIKEELENKIGSRIKLVAQTGRKRQTERRGILSETYPSVFIVDLDQDENAFERVSYSYADILTKSVEVQFSEGEDKELMG